MKGLFSFLAGSTGRWVRIIAGIVLVILGLFLIKGTGGWILALIGLVPLVAGIFDWCFFAPLFGLPFGGPALREKLEKKE
ncbi:MAG: DUF2892 domain-containing protein [Anaerolineales bacterium]|nr:DUF2892 domain-containing protein [Anaerolineales bacterium]